MRRKPVGTPQWIAISRQMHAREDTIDNLAHEPHLLLTDFAMGEAPR